jgi:F1F0 ATPase subunit 2
MVPLSALLSASLTGVVLGCVFFYVLWLSAQKVLGSAHPVRWFICSWLFRMVLAVYGFYLVAGGEWPPLLACLLGFIVGRWLISKVILGRTPNTEEGAGSASKQRRPTMLSVQTTIDDTGAKDAP